MGRVLFNLVLLNAFQIQKSLTLRCLLMKCGTFWKAWTLLRQVALMEFLPYFSRNVANKLRQAFVQFLINPSAAPVFQLNGNLLTLYQYTKKTPKSQPNTTARYPCYQLLVKFSKAVFYPTLRSFKVLNYRTSARVFEKPILCNATAFNSPHYRFELG